MTSNDLFLQAQKLFQEAFNMRVQELTVRVSLLTGLQSQAANAYLIEAKACAKRHNLNDADYMLDVVQAIVERA